MKYDVITIGGLTEDVMFYTHSLKVLKNLPNTHGQTYFAFEAGDKIVSDREVLYTAGGGGANTAVSFAKLGFKTGLIASVGQDRSALGLVEHLKQQRVDITLLQSCQCCRSGLSMVITAGKRNDHILFTNRAANDRLCLNEKKLNRLNTQWFYLTSLSGECWKNNLAVIFKVAAKRQIKVAWNPGSIQLKEPAIVKKYLANTEILILNREEACRLSEFCGLTKQAIKAMGRHLSSFGPKVVSISDGARGAYVYSQGQMYFQKPLPLKPVNSTGAGDAFGSSLVGGLMLYHNDLKKALRLALIRSSLVVTKIGAQTGLSTLKEASKYLK